MAFVYVCVTVTFSPLQDIDDSHVIQNPWFAAWVDTSLKTEEYKQISLSSL